MMKYKKLLIDVMIIITVSILFIIWHYKSENKGALATSSLRNYEIYLITMDKQDQHWYSLNQGVTDMGNLLGAQHIWVAPEFKNTQEQINLLNQAVEAGADIILIAANDPVRISSAIEDAKARGVKIIYVDSPAYEEAITTLSTDNYLAGTIAAKAMISELEAIGTNTGRIGIISVNKETDSTLRREAGFRETMEEDGRFIVLDTEYKNGIPITSEVAATNLMNTYDDLVGIFGTNEGSSIGVGRAIEKNNSSIIGIGFDKSDPILELLRKGSLKAVMAQNPYTMGYLGMAQAVAALKGYDTGPTNIDTGVSVVMRR